MLSSFRPPSSGAIYSHDPPGFRGRLGNPSSLAFLIDCGASGELVSGATSTEDAVRGAKRGADAASYGTRPALLVSNRDTTLTGRRRICTFLRDFERQRGDGEELRGLHPACFAAVVLADAHRPPRADAQRVRGRRPSAVGVFTREAAAGRHSIPEYTLRSFFGPPRRAQCFCREEGGTPSALCDVNQHLQPRTWPSLRRALSEEGHDNAEAAVESTSNSSAHSSRSQSIKPHDQKFHDLKLRDYRESVYQVMYFDLYCSISIR